jgi:hypothetical protein
MPISRPYAVDTITRRWPPGDPEGRMRRGRRAVGARPCWFRPTSVGYAEAMTDLERTFHEPDDEGNIVDSNEVITASGDAPDHAEQPEHPVVGNDAGSAGEKLSGMGGTSGAPSPASGARTERTG